MTVPRGSNPDGYHNGSNNRARAVEHHKEIRFHHGRCCYCADTERMKVPSAFHQEMIQRGKFMTISPHQADPWSQTPSLPNCEQDFSVTYILKGCTEDSVWLYFKFKIRQLDCWAAGFNTTWGPLSHTPHLPSTGGHVAMSGDRLCCPESYCVVLCCARTIGQSREHY